jgi:hypothetical protein
MRSTASCTERPSAAISLYRSSGYRPIERYGRYRDERRCMCFEKTLATG